MQNKSAQQGQTPDDSDALAKDAAINVRLTDHIRANAIRIGATGPAIRRVPKRGIFRESIALFGLIGLMVVSYVYVKLIGEEA